MSLFQFSHAYIPKLLEALLAIWSVGHFMGGYSSRWIFCGDEGSCCVLSEV